MVERDLAKVEVAGSKPVSRSSFDSKSRERSGFDPHRDPYPEVATLTLGADVVEVLPVDQLGIAILRDLIDTQEWNEYNYLLYAQRAYDGKPRAVGP